MFWSKQNFVSWMALEFRESFFKYRPPVGVNIVVSSVVVFDIVPLLDCYAGHGLEVASHLLC